MSDSMDNLMKAPKIRIHFNVHEPVELVEMTLAFQALGYEYQSFMREESIARGERINSADIKLYITKIESNCILADLAPALPLLGPLVPLFSDVNTVADFVRNIGALIDWLIGVGKNGKIEPDEIPYTKKRISNVRDVVRLVSKNNESNLGLSALRYEESDSENKSILEVKFSERQCADAEQGAIKALEALETRERADKEKVLMYFYQTNIDDPKSTGRTGDKALIQSVSKDPLSVYILSEIDQQRIRYVLDDKSHNPLLTGFVVDVNIENDRRGQPKIYRVLRVHDVIYGDDE